MKIPLFRSFWDHLKTENLLRRGVACGGLIVSVLFFEYSYGVYGLRFFRFFSIFGALTVVEGCVLIVWRVSKYWTKAIDRSAVSVDLVGEGFQFLDEDLQPVGTRKWGELERVEKAPELSRLVFKDGAVIRVLHQDYSVFEFKELLASKRVTVVLDDY